MTREEAVEKIQKFFFRETQTDAKMQAEIMLKFFEEQLEMVPPDRSYCHCNDCNGGPIHSWDGE